MMTSFSIWSLGCKVNQYESQQVRKFLQQWGLQPVALDARPDLIIIHTCCVTATASAKSRQSIRRLQRQCPHATMVVCGCLPSSPTNELCDMPDGLLFVRNREALADELGRLMDKAAFTRLEEGAPEHQFVTIKTDPNHKSKSDGLNKASQLPSLTHFSGQTRAFLKIQDGCDAHCAYCIIPKIRSKLSSKPLPKALEEARALVESGHKEIVVTGVYLGAYGHTTSRHPIGKPAPNERLYQLLDQLAQVPGLQRIRLSSLEPADVTEGLLDVMANHDNIMPHLHLSLQSGADAVLKRMGRRYSRDDFENIASQARQHLDRPALTTDIIVGFPGETDADFQQTLALAHSVGFAKIHVFSFSPRAETAAATMKNQVHNQTILARSTTLRELDLTLGRQYRDQFCGQTAKVLIENTQGHPSGLSERYFQVFLPTTGQALHKNDLITVNLHDHQDEGLQGSPASTLEPL